MRDSLLINRAAHWSNASPRGAIVKVEQLRRLKVRGALGPVAFEHAFQLIFVGVAAGLGLHLLLGTAVGGTSIRALRRHLFTRGQLWLGLIGRRALLRAGRYDRAIGHDHRRAAAWSDAARCASAGLIRRLASSRNAARRAARTGTISVSRRVSGRLLRGRTARRIA